MPFFATSFAAPLLLCVSAAAQDNALELFHKMQRALGGADTIAGVQDFDQTVKATAWRPNGELMGDVRKRVRWVKPNYLRLDQAGPGDTFVLYFDGKSGWEILPDGHQADLSGGELDFARKYLDHLLLRIWLADRTAGYAITSPDRNIVRVSTNRTRADQLDITLDPGTSLPLKEASISLADPAHPSPSETQFREWTTVQGIKFPTRVWVLHNGVKLADIATEDLKFNAGVRTKDLAAKPTGLKPQMRN